MASSDLKNKDQQSNRALVRNIIIVVSVFVFAIVYDVAIGGNIRFYSKWAECGQEPVPTMGSGWRFTDGVPHYYDPPRFSLLRPSIEYFCTPLEAEEAGYSASPNRYDFPHLEKNRD